ncbi:MAG TPA: DNA helicase RecQ [Flavobacteriales bacterium]|nr:DNA helicase RecQ [Flavobacteriales bacterium]HQV75489.1 DNA helicase RecQ [Flavobacteriales bacterium]
MESITLAEPPSSYGNSRTPLLELLERHFGYKSFRPLQQEVIQHVLEGNDAVVLMPTGGGKSLCYQVPAVALNGLTVVVSPLIALMKDQVQALQGNGIRAAFLNSSLGYEEERTINEQLRNGELKLLYVSPERLFQQGFLDRLEEFGVKLFAVDEAHCISSWGHSFRPEYKHLNVLKKRFPHVPVVALTATADRAVRNDIGDLLGLNDPRTFVSSFDRSNLSLAVLPGQDRWKAIERIIGRHSGKCGIIYCNSRAGTEKLAAKLQAIGVSAAYYHAKLDPVERNRVQDDFIQGKLHVICATIAFGMGIDKSDVRFVIHYNLPGTVEGYYQEIGRAGRDGEPAETILFYSYADVQTHMHFADEIEDERYKEVVIAKLDRMKEYAQAQTCRRTILLSYFSESSAEACGNCDVCKDPPKYFDGTVLAQKALSAVVRSGQKLPLSVLVDVLKGTTSPAVSEHGWQRIKTFGAGNETTAFAWVQFIQQFIHLGLLEVDYRDHHHLIITRAGEAVLKGERPVGLVTPETIKERQERPKRTRQVVAEPSPESAELLAVLKELRRTIAKEMGKPAYVVFSDASLIDMADKKPKNVYEFRLVNGVGDYKAQQFGKAFLEAVKGWKD